MTMLKTMIERRTQASTIKNMTLGTDVDHEVEAIGRCDEVIGVPGIATILLRK